MNDKEYRDYLLNLIGLNDNELENIKKIKIAIVLPDTCDCLDDNITIDKRLKTLIKENRETTDEKVIFKNNILIEIYLDAKKNDKDMNDVFEAAAYMFANEKETKTH